MDYAFRFLTFLVHLGVKEQFRGWTAFNYLVVDINNSEIVKIVFIKEGRPEAT